MAKKSVYARLASRFAHLALGAKEEDEDKEEAAEDEPTEPEEGRRGQRSDDKAAKKGKKAKDDEPCAEDEDDDEEASAQAAEDEDDDEEDEKEEERKKARASERGRWAAVLSSSEAKGRVPLACSLLADTDMSSEKIRVALLASPVEGRHGLAARMAAVARPDVGSASAATGPDPSTPKGRAAEMMKAYDKAIGR